MSRSFAHALAASLALFAGPFAAPASAETTSADTGGLLTGLSSPAEAMPSFAAPVPRHAIGPRLYVRGAGGITAMQLYGDFDPAAYPDAVVFFPPFGVLEPERAQADIGFAVGGAVGVRVPWGAAGATRFEAEYMFRTASLDRVVYEEDFGIRPEADITGRITGHSVMGNVIAEWRTDYRWRFGVGGGLGVLFTELKANGRRDSGAAFAGQILCTGEYMLAEHVWLTTGLTILGATRVDYDTDIQRASTLAVDFTVGIGLEF